MPIHYGVSILAMHPDGESLALFREAAAQEKVTTAIPPMGGTVNF